MPDVAGRDNKKKRRKNNLNNIDVGNREVGEKKKKYIYIHEGE